MNRKCLSTIFSFLIIALAIIIIHPALVMAEKGISLLYADIDGSISPAQVELLEDIIGRAVDDDHDLILLRLDTPGGLGSSMRDMVKIMMISDIPVCVWVGPEGAHAASAGAFIVAAAEVAAMAPGTTLGAASPVSSSGDDLPETMNKKVKNDMVSLIKGIARKRGRNFEWYAKAVNEGVSLSAQEAATLNVINFMASSVDDFLEQLGAKGVLLKGDKVKFSLTDVQVFRHEPGLRYSVLSWLLDPQVAYFLLIGGILGIFFELSHPGAILPGVVGGFCFVTALYAMSILPTNAAGLILLLFGAVLFILEAFIVSYGLLSVAAIISLFIGSLVLFRGGEMQQIPLGTIIGTVLSFSAFSGTIVYLVSKAQLKGTGMGLQAMVGLEGEVIKLQGRKMKVRVRGEIWKAVSDGSGAFEPGTVIEVVQADGLLLRVVKKS